MPVRVWCFMKKAIAFGIYIYIFVFDFVTFRFSLCLKAKMAREMLDIFQNLSSLQKKKLLEFFQLNSAQVFVWIVTITVSGKFKFLYLSCCKCHQTSNWLAFYPSSMSLASVFSLLKVDLIFESLLIRVTKSFVRNILRSVKGLKMLILWWKFHCNHGMFSSLMG